MRAGKSGYPRIHRAIFFPYHFNLTGILFLSVDQRGQRKRRQSRQIRLRQRFHDVGGTPRPGYAA